MKNYMKCVKSQLVDIFIDSSSRAKNASLTALELHHEEEAKGDQKIEKLAQLMGFEAD